MGALVEFPTKRQAPLPHESRPPDERVEQARLAEGPARDQRRRIAFIKGVKWVSLAALLAAAGQWAHPGAYDAVVRFVVTAGALVMMLQALRFRYYVVASAFGAMVLLYNPAAPLFAFSGAWQNALVVTSAAPFVASLAWREPRMECNV